MPATFPAKLPIIQAPMAGVQDAKLAIAVSRAGGVGSLACAMLSTEGLARQLEQLTAAQLPIYNLNFFCHKAVVPDPAQAARWQQALDPYYQELGIDPATAHPGAGRTPFSEETLALIRLFRPPIVSFHFGLPKPEWVDEIKSWGGQVWSSATTADEAIWLEENGASAVIAQGIEAGGHRGSFLSDDMENQPATLTLLSDVRAAVNLPVIAAGGIAGPEQVASVLEQGAWAVQVGTAYLCCDEASTSALHRRQLLSESARDTALTNLFSGRPARGIVNRLIRDLGPLSDLPPAFPYATAALAPLRRAAEARGSVDFSPLWSGTDASGCREVSAAEQTRWLAGVD